MHEFLQSVPLIDTHVHRLHPDREPEFGQIAGGYIPGPGQERNARQTILFGMIMQALRERFGMPPHATDAEVEAERHRRYAADRQGYIRALMDEGNVAMHCFEIGSPLRGKAYTRQEADFFNAAIDEKKRCCIVRIERSVDELLAEKLPFREFVSAFEKDLDGRVATERAVGLKSSIAYYGGLDIQRQGEEAAAAAYERMRAGKALPTDEKCLYGYMLMQGIEIAVKHGLPTQIHTGAGGGSYLDFKTFNPVWLADFLRDERILNRAKIVLLHGGHPHEEDTSFLTAQYANVYTDFSGTFFLCGVNGAPRLRALLERTPMNKLMYGSDGVMFPETAWFAHRYFRKLLAKVLAQLVDEGFLSEQRARDVAQMVMHGNALECYSQLKDRVRFE